MRIDDKPFESYRVAFSVSFQRVSNQEVYRSMLDSEEPKKSLEKSYMERVIFETIVKYKPSNENMISDLCSDLSVGGLYLRTEFAFDIGETVEISFPLPNQECEILISCKARVAWENSDTNRRKPDYPSGVGLQFLDLSHEDFTTLSNFIDTYDENKKMNVICAWCGSYLGMRKGPFGTTSHGLCSECFNRIEGNFTS